MTREEIQIEIERLRALDRELEVKEQVRYEARAKQFVGRCYRNITGQVFKIIDIPRKTYHCDFSTTYRKHYFKVFQLEYAYFPDDYEDFDEFAPCHCDEYYFDVIQFDNPYGCTEITQEEFDAEFDKCIAHFKEQISV